MVLVREQHQLVGDMITTVFDNYNVPQNDFVMAISTAVHRKYHIPFCVESAKCILKKNLRIGLFVFAKHADQGNSYVY